MLLVNREGRITEGSRSNVFFIRGREVWTAPSDRVLLGVTRSKVIDVIREAGLDLHFKSVREDHLASFDAAFISGTSPKVLPIASIGDISYDVNDPVLRDIMKRYETCENREEN